MEAYLRLQRGPRLVQDGLRGFLLHLNANSPFRLWCESAVAFDRQVVLQIIGNFSNFSCTELRHCILAAD